MYTIDDEKNNLYEEEYYDSNWDNRKGLIFKIIIIILCIIVLIWLIKALKSNRNYSDNGSVHIANVEKVRLAAEDYFFIKKNMNNTSKVSLSGLKREGLINDVIDANNKVCSDNGTIVTLDKEIDTYTMKINLSCSTNDKEEVFYYHRNTLACLNCSDNTRMKGNIVVINDDSNQKEFEDEENNSNEESQYLCNEWSKWTRERVDDKELTERTKVLVTGVKHGKTKKVYGDWSEYTTTPIDEENGIEVETKKVTQDNWGSYQTSTSIDISNPRIRVVSRELVHSAGNTNSACTNGFISNNYCYSNNVIVGNLTYREYTSGNYLIQKEHCEAIRTLKNSQGDYEVTFINCRYNKRINSSTQNISNSYTVYTYQELESEDVTYYRYRTVEKQTEEDIYTDIKYEEKNLPEGYSKLAGSEETYYSYRLTECVK